jgi:hypothetical protein
MAVPNSVFASTDPTTFRQTGTNKEGVASSLMLWQHPIHSDQQGKTKLKAERANTSAATTNLLVFPQGRRNRAIFETDHNGCFRKEQTFSISVSVAFKFPMMIADLVW